MFVIRTNNSATTIANWAAVEHAKALNAQYESTFSLSDKFKADLVERLVKATFNSSTVYKNFRQQFIAIKVCSPLIEELISDNCRLLFDACHSNNIEIVHTKTGVIFRIYPV